MIRDSERRICITHLVRQSCQLGVKTLVICLNTQMYAYIVSLVMYDITISVYVILDITMQKNNT